MIIDTTYLLPLVKIDVDTDLLRAAAEEKVDLQLSEMTISLISVFELQAKAANLSIPAKFVAESVEAIFTTFRVEPFHKTKTLEFSFELRRSIPDYIDCIIAATAGTLKQDLATEDSRILDKRKMIEDKYGIRVLRYKDLLHTA